MLRLWFILERIVSVPEVSAEASREAFRLDTVHKKLVGGQGISAIRGNVKRSASVVWIRNY
jgi:hypothetical protein